MVESSRSLMATFLTVLVAFSLGNRPAVAAEWPPPKGTMATPDSTGGIELLWLYPGLNTVTRHNGSGALLMPMYISREPGEHQLACRFSLPPVRQWIESIELWVEEGRDYSLERWAAAEPLSFSLHVDSAGLPGARLGDVVAISPSAGGIPDSGGNLLVQFDLPFRTTSPESVWVVMSWPAGEPDLIRFGVDDTPHTGSALFHVAQQAEPYWIPWISHNPLFSLNVLQYSSSCNSNSLAATDPTVSLPRLLTGDSFIVERVESCAGEEPVVGEALGTASPGRLCFYDTSVIAGSAYQYGIRAVVGADTTAPDTVSILAASPFACGWEPLDTIALSIDSEKRWSFKLENRGSAHLSARFAVGWLKPAGWHLSSQAGMPPQDSVPVQSSPEAWDIPPYQQVLVDLTAEDRAIPSGEYELVSVFRIADDYGRYGRYRFAGMVQVLDPVGINETEADHHPAVRSLSVYPNPARGGATLQVAPATSEGAYSISVYDILGREVAAWACPVQGAQGLAATHYFDGKDKIGNSLPSAVYFVRVSGKGWSACRKIVILR